MAVSKRQRALAESNLRESSTDPNHTATGHRRKDKKRWCRGKVGIEHEWMIGKHPKHFYRSHPRTHDDECHESSWSFRGKLFWRCVEQEWCTKCGKIRRDSLGEDCTVLKEQKKIND